MFFLIDDHGEVLASFATRDEAEAALVAHVNAEPQAADALAIFEFRNGQRVGEPLRYGGPALVSGTPARRSAVEEKPVAPRTMVLSLEELLEQIRDEAQGDVNFERLTELADELGAKADSFAETLTRARDALEGGRSEPGQSRKSGGNPRATTKRRSGRRP